MRNLEAHPTFIAALPHTQEEYRPGIQQLWEHLSSGKMEKNLAIIATLAYGCHQSLSDTFPATEEDRRQLLSFAHLARDLKNVSRKYVGAQPLYPQAPRAYDSLKTTLPHVIEMNAQTLPRQELVAVIEDFLAMTREETNILFATDSHIMLSAELSALHALGYRHIGVVVFDRHTDIFSTRTEQQAYGTDPDKLNPLGKHNTLSWALQQGEATAICIIGVQPGDRANIVDEQFAEDHEFHPTVDVYKRFKDRISIADERKFLNRDTGNRSFVPLAFKDEIRRQVDFLRNAGVEHIVFSFDVDVLDAARNGYTVMEYSPLSDLLYLAVLDLEKLNQLYLPEKTKEQVLLAQASLIRDAYDHPLAHTDLLLNSLTHEQRQIASCLPMMSSAANGLPLGMINQAVDVIKEYSSQLGITIGVRLSSGGTYLGDIAELSGHDVGNRSAKAADAFIRRVSR